ncbi:MAG: polysaccharide pyruvyl transferase family protein [Rikenellaceae bacterium]
MGKKINLLWWNNAQGNFGDEASPYIIEHLSGIKVKLAFPTLKQYFIRAYVLLGRRKPISALMAVLSFRCKRKVLLAVGSILKESNHKTIAWGTGFMYKDDVVTSGVFTAVRGKCTSSRLEELGLNAPKVYGDPALLLPLIYNPQIKKTGKVGIIPHYSEYEKYYALYSNHYTIINLNTNNIERTIDSVVECSYILSSSLHGIIVAQAYGVAALWFEDSILLGDGFKFEDYFSSVNITPYKGFDNIDDILKQRSSIEAFFEKHKELSKINLDLLSLQKELLKAAPFKLDVKYREILQNK